MRSYVIDFNGAIIKINFNVKVEDAETMEFFYINKSVVKHVRDTTGKI